MSKVGICSSKYLYSERGSVEFSEVQMSEQLDSFLVTCTAMCLPEDCYDHYLLYVDVIQVEQSTVAFHSHYHML